MANRELDNKVPVNKECFLRVISECGSSIRKLGGAMYDEIQRTEKTIRHYLNLGEMPLNLLDRIARNLNVHPDYLSGVYHEKANKIEDEYLHHLFISRLKPENYPYVLKARSDLDYVRYFEDILTMNDIGKELVNSLSIDERRLLYQELVAAIYGVIARHFKKDSLGNDTQEWLDYHESNVGDEDPYSLFSELAGITPDDIREI